MGTGTLTDRSSGDIILEGYFNDIHSALNGDFVGRNSSGVPASGQALGTAAFPWGVIRGNSLIIGGSSVDVSQVAALTHRLISGKTRATSGQPAFLTPAGSGNGASVTVAAASTNLSFDVAGQSYTLSSDLAKASLTTAPSTNNTCQINDTDAADQNDTRLWGEPINSSKVITIDTIGSEISSLDGTFQAFSHGAGPEILFGYVDTSNNRLTHCYRGFFYDESLDPVKREVFSNNDVLTLLKTGWVFLDSDLTTVDVTYNNPTWSATAPSSPATGDYWFDLSSGNNLMKRYDGASFQTVSRVFIGWVVLDDTDCLYARCANFDSTFKSDLGMPLEISTTSIVSANNAFSMAHVYGNRLEYHGGVRPTWNITTDLAGADDMYTASEQASTFYHLYIDTDGDTIMSDIEPYYRGDLQGWYHPHNPWREVGRVYNDSGSDLADLEDKSGEEFPNSEVHVRGGNGFGSTTGTSIRRFSSTRHNRGTAILYADSATAGATFTIQRRGIYAVHYSDNRNDGGAQAGISINSTQLTTGPNAITSDDRLAMAASDTANKSLMSSWTGLLEIGDVIRAHANNNCTDDGDDQCIFQITHIR